MGWDGMTYQSHEIGWDAMKQLVPWEDFFVPSHRNWSPDISFYILFYFISYDSLSSIEGKAIFLIKKTLTLAKKTQFEKNRKTNSRFGFPTPGSI